MNKNKKFIIFSIIATILAAVTIFLIIGYQNQKAQQQLQQEIVALKKEHDQLLTQISNVNWQSYVDEFYSAQAQKIFQQQKAKIKKEIKDLKVNVTCDQSDLKAQKQCWLNFNQKINQTINNFHYFNDSYYDSYQKFNVSLVQTKNQIHDLLTQMSQLNTTEFNNTVYDLNFLSPEKQNEFQNNKSQIIATIEQLNNSQTEQITTCSQNKTLYQQLVCCQQKKQTINKALNNFNSFDHDYQSSYQIFNATFDATKKQFDHAVALITTNYDLGFLSFENQAALQNDQKQILSNMTKLIDFMCDQNKDLYQQLVCFQQQKQLINNLTTKFRNFDHDYQHLYQTFNNTFRETKKQFDILLLKIAAFNNKEYNSDFFSPVEQVVFQNNKSQVTSNVQKINHSTCSQNKTLYQQLMCYQEKNAIMNETIKNFNSFDHDYHHNYQKFNATLNTAKKQFDALLADLTVINDYQYTDDDIDFLKPQKQIGFQINKNQIINMKEHFNNSTCSQNKMLYQQLSCYQEKNQEMNKTINYFDHFDDYYQQMKQKFVHDFQNAKQQLAYLLATMTEIDITAFNNTPYDLGFLSSEKQDEFQKNKSKIISNVQKINNSTCSQNKMLKCYQEKNQTINDEIVAQTCAKKGSFYQLLCYQEKNQKINKIIATQQQTCAKKGSLYQQLLCYQEKNQEMNKTINYFDHFDDYYQQMKQKFVHDFQNAKQQLAYLLATMTEIDITTFNNTPYNLGFLSSEKQDEFQKNKSKIISNVKKINNSTCSQNKMLYQQLKCYQEKNQTINDEIVVQPTCAKKGSFYQLLCYQEKNQKINKIIATQQQTCAKKGSLYQQLLCYQEKNQEMNKTINYFDHFDDYYQQMKQKFDDDFQIVKKNFGDLLAAVTTLDQTEYLKFLSSEEQLMLKLIVDGTKQFNHSQEKECLQNKNLYQQLKCYQENVNTLIVNYNQIESKKQFLNLTAQISSLDVDELKTTEFTLNFFSFEQKVTFQDNKKIIINNLPPIQKKIPSITESLEFYQKFGTIYQQILHYQKHIQIFSEQLAFCQNFKKQYFEAFKLSLAVENIKSGIKKIQTELEDIFMQNPNNVIENKIAIILEKIMDFEKKVKTYEKQPWSQFRAYHDFLAQQQEYFVETKHYVDNIIENIAVIKVTYTNNDIVSLISTINFNKEHVKLLTQMPKNVNWQSYVDDFYDQQTQKQFQNQKDKLQQEIKDLNLKVNVVNCDDQSNLEAQKQCWLNFNQKMNQTINNFHYFNDSYYDSYQTFNTTLNTTKKQFFNNLVSISKLNTTELNNKEYDLNFFSPEKQNEFQSNKSQIINTIKQLNHSQTEQITTCSQNKTLYQQLMCYQEKNAIINETIKNFNSFDDDYHHNYQIFNATFNETKAKFNNLLSNTKKEFDDNEKKFLNIKEIEQFAEDKNQVIAMIKQFNTTKEKCFQNKNLYQQAKCYQKNVAYLMTGFDQVKAKKKFLELKGQILTLNISELTNINVNFLSLKKQKELLKKQKNLIKVILQIQNELQNNIKFKSYNNFYPQSYHPSLSELQYYQKQNQQIGAQLKIFQTFKKQYFDSFESSLFTLIAKIKVGIKLANEKQQELTILQKTEQNAIITIAAARTQNITQRIQNINQKIQNITQKFQNVTQNVANFEKEIKQYANLPWSQFKAYHDFLVKYQNILQVSKEDIFEAKSIIEFIITGGIIFDEENI